MRKQRLKGSTLASSEEDFGFALEALATVLDAGVSIESAWQYIAQANVHSEITNIFRLMNAGVSVSAALEHRIQACETSTLKELALVWSLSETSGSSLSMSLRGLALSIRDRSEINRECDIALSGPKATARLVSWLPIGGLVLAFLTGADTLLIAFSSVIAWISVGGGVLMAVFGQRWMKSIIGAARPKGAFAGVGADALVIALRSGMSLERAQQVVERECARFGIEGCSSELVNWIFGFARKSGAPVVDLLTSHASKERSLARTQGRKKAAKSAVALMIPMGVCILPSFFLTAVFPLVLGIMLSTMSTFF